MTTRHYNKSKILAEKQRVRNGRVAMIENEIQEYRDLVALHFDLPEMKRIFLDRIVSLYEEIELINDPNKDELNF